MKPSLLRAIALVTAMTLSLVACTSSGATAAPTGTSPVIVPPTSTAAPSVTAVPSPSPTPAPTASGLAGQWNGTWQNSQPDHASGTFTLKWTQTGSNLSGTITINGTPCLTGGTIAGTVNGGAISFGVVSGEVQVSYDGSVSGNKMQGTYATTCGNAKGAWAATKK